MAALRKALEPIEVHIVPMRRRHLRSVLRIEAQVYPRPWSHSLFVSELALRSTRAYVVAKVGRDVVGYAGLMMSLTDGHVTTIAVDPRWHRHGIGTRLLLALAREAIARGATALTLEVRLSNKPAQEMYRRFGFVPVGVRKGYYADTGEDALVMWAYEVDRPRVRRAARRARSDGSRARPSTSDRSRGDAHPRNRDVVRRDRGRGRRRRSHDALVGRREPGRPARALRRRRARDREPRARRADRRRDRGGAGRGRHRSLGRSTRSPRSTARVSRARSSSASARPRRSRRDRRRRTSASTITKRTCTPRCSRIPTLEPPLLTLDRVGRAHAARRDGGPRQVPRARPDRRRRGRRGLRQGRALPRARVSGRPAHRPARARGRPDRDRVPAPDARRRRRLLVLRPEDRGRAVGPQASRTSTVADVAASFQAAVVDVLVAKLLRAAERTGIATVVIGGGVAANSALRARVLDDADAAGLRAVLPSPALCTDNAAMVAACAWWRFRADGPTPLDDGVDPGLRIG